MSPGLTWTLDCPSWKPAGWGTPTWRTRMESPFFGPLSRNRPRADWAGTVAARIAIRRPIAPMPLLHHSRIALVVNAVASHGGVEREALDFVVFPRHRRRHVETSADGSTSPGDTGTDLVVSTQVLEHVPSPRRHLDEAFRVLHADGRLILSTHGYWVYHPDPEDLWRWTGPGLRRALGEAGFTVTSCGRTGGPFGCGSAATARRDTGQGAVAHPPSLLLPVPEGHPWARPFCWGRAGRRSCGAAGDCYEALAKVSRVCPGRIDASGYPTAIGRPPSAAPRPSTLERQLGRLSEGATDRSTSCRSRRPTTPGQGSPVGRGGRFRGVAPGGVERTPSPSELYGLSPAPTGSACLTPQAGT